MDLLSVSVVVLWLLVLILAVVVFALARQVGVLYERVAPAGALMVNQQLQPGDSAPRIGIETLEGEALAIATAGQAQLLFFLSPDCPICKSLLPVLKRLRKTERAVQFVLVSDGDDIDAHRRMVNDEALGEFPYALSEAAGRSFGVSKLPYAVLIDAAGIVSALGIVNSREHLESLFEAQRLGVASIQEYLGNGAQVQGEPQASDSLHYDATNR